MNMAEAIDLAEAAHPSSPRTVYVIMRTEGEYIRLEGVYRDSVVECVVAFYNEESAKHFVERIEEEINRFHPIKMTEEKFEKTKENYQEYVEKKGYGNIYEEIENINIDLFGNDFPLLKEMVKLYKTGNYAHPMDWETGGEGASRFYIQEVKVSI